MRLFEVLSINLLRSILFLKDFLRREVLKIEKASVHLLFQEKDMVEN